MITKRIEQVLINQHRRDKLDKTRVMKVLLMKFDTWKNTKDLPKGTLTKTKKLFQVINKAFEEQESEGN